MLALSHCYNIRTTMDQLDQNHTIQTATQSSTTTYAIDPDMPVAELQRLYPHVIDFLIMEYGFHCAGCFMSQFETLREGAAVHMITDQYFEEMMTEIGRLVENSPQSDPQ